MEQLVDKGDEKRLRFQSGLGKLCRGTANCNVRASGAYGVEEYRGGAVMPLKSSLLFVP